MKTCLETYCELVGWQGGTIHQAKEHFASLDKDRQTIVFSDLGRKLSTISDYHTVKEFGAILTNHLKWGNL